MKFVDSGGLKINVDGIEGDIKIEYKSCSSFDTSSAKNQYTLSLQFIEVEPNEAVLAHGACPSDDSRFRLPHKPNSIQHEPASLLAFSLLHSL